MSREEGMILTAFRRTWLNCLFIFVCISLVRTFFFSSFFDYIGHKQYSAQIGHSSSYHRNPMYEILHTNGGSVVVSNNMYLSKLRCIIKMCPIKTLLLKTKICRKLSRFGIVCTQKCRNLPFTVFNTNKYQAKSYPCSHHCALSTWWCTRFAFNDNFLTFFHSLCSSLFELCLSNQWEALSKQERVNVTFHTWIQLNFNNDTNKKNKWWNERMAETRVSGRVSRMNERTHRMGAHTRKQ